MCGILGLVGRNSEELVDKHLDLLAHRGPDDRGVWSNDFVALGHRRLAIIGLDAAGAQPYHGKTRSSVISFNGEIYNYLELSDRLKGLGVECNDNYDTDILINSLEHWGISSLEHIHGMFAFAWYDKPRRKLYLCRDRFGEKPLFWGYVTPDDGQRRLMFASEFNVFSAVQRGGMQISPLGLARYLSYDGMPCQQTIWKDVFKLPPAHYLEIDVDECTTRLVKYWDLIESSASFADSSINDLEEALGNALSSQLRSDVPVGLFLSGGIDSSTLLGLLCRDKDIPPVETFTIGFEETSYDESEAAKTMAAHAGTQHRMQKISGHALHREIDQIWNQLSEPFADPSIVPFSLLSRFSREYVKVAIGGDGADEFQAGYDPFRAWFVGRLLDGITFGQSSRMISILERLIPVNDENMSLRFKLAHFGRGMAHPVNERIQGWMAGFSTSMMLDVLNPETLSEFELGEVLEPSRKAFDSARHLGELHAQINTWISTYMECCILTKVDRASMMHSLEVRAPFLDVNLASMMFALKAKDISSGNQGKVAIRQIGERIVPNSLLRRKKKGFGVPQSKWLKSIMKERMQEAIEGSRSSNFFNYDGISKLWRQHLNGSHEVRRALWNYLFVSQFIKS